jgi:hypothetical protein
MSDFHGEQYPQFDDKEHLRSVQFADNEFRKSGQTLMRRVCVMVAHRDGTVAVRDSKDATRTTLYFNEDEWRAFVLGVKAGEFDFDLF